MGTRRQAVLIAACVMCAATAAAKPAVKRPKTFAKPPALVFEATLAAPKETKLGPGPMVVTSQDGSTDVFYGGKTTYVATGGPKKMKRKSLKTGRVYRVALTADGTQLATVTEAGEVGLWNTKSGKRLGKWTTAVAALNGTEVLFVGDAIVVHTGCRLLKFEAKRKEPTPIGTPSCVEAEVEFANRSAVFELGAGRFVFLPVEDSDTGEFGYVRRTIQLLDPATGDVVLSATASGEIEQLAVSPTGDRVCFTVAEMRHLWCSEGGSTGRITEGMAPESLLAFDPDGKRVVFVDTSDHIIMIDFVASTIQEVATTTRKRVIWLDNHRLGAYGGSDGLGYEVFDLSSGKSTTLLPKVEIDFLAAARRDDRWLVARAKGGSNVFYEARAQP